MKYILFIFVLIQVTIFSQNLDSLYNQLIEIKSQTIKDINPTVSIRSNENEKCGFGIYAGIKSHLNEFSKTEQGIIQKIMSRPILSKSIVSPTGKFRIHYETSGIHMIEYDVQELALAFDSAYTYEVNLLDYPEPPSDGLAGGDNKYDIYVKNLNGGLYGATSPDSSIGDGRSTSYIEIDNSFKKSEGYNTYGIEAARATAAHEFHHSIQLGAYGYFDSDLFYHELTSTAFEEFVFDHVNDYYAYMYSYFVNTSKKLQNNSGYNLAVWNIFLQERFEKDNDYDYLDDPKIGHNIVKRSWELMHDYDNRAMTAIGNAILEISGKSFPQLFKEFGEWLYFTNENALEGSFFSEAKFYPPVRINYSMPLDNSSKTINFESIPTSLNYISFDNVHNNRVDTIVVVVSNPDVNGSLSNNNNSNVELTLSNSEFSGSNSINGLYFNKIVASPFASIQSSFIINNVLIESGNDDLVKDYVFPQPYNNLLQSSVYIPSISSSISGNFYIYSIDMDLVYNDVYNFSISGSNLIQWDGRNNNGKKVSNGVYIYVVQSDDKIKKGKLVVVN